MSAADRPGARRTVSIVVPTLREAANIPILAGRIRSALSGSGMQWEILLVDDDSNDGSEEIVAALARWLPVRMEVRRNAPRDLSLAVLHGIRLARFDRVVVMDADLSHPPTATWRSAAGTRRVATSTAPGAGHAG